MSSIFNASAQCRQTFKAAAAVPTLMQREWAENRMAEFNLWASGCGVFATGRASLDYRLSSNGETQGIVVNLLLMLDILLQQCIEAVQENQSEVTGDAWSEELCKRISDVEESLDQLARLTLAIRKAGTKSRLLKADSLFSPDDEQICAFRRHLELLLLVSPEIAGCASSVGQQLMPDNLDPIQRRLIDANLLRRHRFLYAQKHSQKLGPHKNVHGTLLNKAAPVILQHAQSGGSQAPSAYPKEGQSVPAQSTTTATMVDEPVQLPPKRAITSTTVVSVTTSRISYPRPPSTYQQHKVFSCPCCCQILPSTVAQGNRWKKHIMGDVLPYTCILHDCPSPDNFFSTKDAWLRHMNSDHKTSSQWVCQTCAQKKNLLTFHEAEGLVSHIKDKHRDGIKVHHIPMLVSAWQRDVPLEISRCPLCGFHGDNEKMGVDHVAEHVHSFALRSLPWNDERDERNKGPLSYFAHHDYFDCSGSDSSFSSTSREGQSTSTESEDQFDPSSVADAPLTEEALQLLSGTVPRWTDAHTWLAEVEGGAKQLEPKSEPDSELLSEHDFDHLDPELTEPVTDTKVDTKYKSVVEGVGQPSELLGNPEKKSRASSIFSDMLHRVSGQPESYKRKSLYRFGKAVGQGTHSIVREADCVLGKVAVKVILKRNIRDLEHKFFTEAEVLKRLNHPNIIRYIEHYESKDKLYLVTELARGGELFDRLCELGNFTETLASQAVSQILEAIHYMHQRNILYLDLKTENVMYETRDINSRLMLIDFGTAKMLDPSEQGLKKMVGSFGHAAPEVMLKEGCGKPADMWSLGVIAYELLCGYSPFRAENLPELIEECRVGKIIFHERYWHNISSDAKDFIRGLLQVDPAKRPSAEQARKHRWITDYSVGTKEEAPSVPGTR